MNPHTISLPDTTSVTDELVGNTTDTGHDLIKRGLVRQPPEQFIVEMLSPSKSPLSSDGFTFDMRITPLAAFLTPVSSNSSDTPSNASTSRATASYVIHRTWEDCLWLQEGLEVAYKNRARQKKNQLKAGKGLKTKGVYKRSDGASSWESLPYGPAHASIVLDMHEYLPKLTKKGTFFKPSMKTIDTRYKELKAFVQGLFGADEDTIPALLRELRGERITTDFFGVWRRDWDIGVKTGEIIDTTTRKSAPSMFTSSRKRRSSTASSSSSSSGGSSSRNSTATFSTTTSFHDSDGQKGSPARSRPPPSALSPKMISRLGAVPRPPSSIRPPSSYRESWQSTDSGATFLQGLGISMPGAPTSGNPNRLSVASFMTDASSEAVLQAEPELVGIVNTNNDRYRIPREEDEDEYDLPVRRSEEHTRHYTDDDEVRGSDLRRSRSITPARRRQHRAMSIMSVEKSDGNSSSSENNFDPDSRESYEWRISTSSNASTLAPRIVFSSSPDLLKSGDDVYDDMPQTARRESVDSFAPSARDSAMSLGLPEFEMSEDVNVPDWDIPDTPRPGSAFFTPRPEDKSSSSRVSSAPPPIPENDGTPTSPKREWSAKRDTMQLVQSVLTLSSFPDPPSRIPPTPIRMHAAASNLQSPPSPPSPSVRSVDSYALQSPVSPVMPLGPMVTIKATLEFPTMVTIVLRVAQSTAYEDVRARIKDKVESAMQSDVDFFNNPDTPSSATSHLTMEQQQQTKVQVFKLGAKFGMIGNGRMVADEKDWKTLLGGDAGPKKVFIKIMDTLSNAGA